MGASHQASEVVYLNRDSFFIYWPMMRTTLLSGYRLEWVTVVADGDLKKRAYSCPGRWLPS